VRNFDHSYAEATVLKDREFRLMLHNSMHNIFKAYVAYDVAQYTSNMAAFTFVYGMTSLSTHVKKHS